MTSESRILTISGVACSGVRTIGRELLHQLSGARMIPMRTTRVPQSTDIMEQYVQITYQEMQIALTSNHRLYGVCRGVDFVLMSDDVECVLDRTEGYGLLILPPTAVFTVHQFISSCYGSATDRLMPFFITTPEEAVLRARARRCGEDLKSLEVRWQEELLWEQRAAGSSVPYTFVENPEHPEGKVDIAVKQILAHLGL